ncbi:MAG: molybdopterin-dependent oxidoreductase [Chloroflexi bacterium]|nr:molybdopterin-dependent oxidoreductase [Chloroflexota bacterium]
MARSQFAEVVRMLSSPDQTRTVRTCCGLCAVHCPAVATVEAERVVALRPDASHPYGGALCAKGRAAPELLDHPERVDYPLRRTRPKTDPDPGWERCTWDEALDLVARKLLEVRAASGPEAVVFSKGTGGGTGLTDTEAWLGRLANCFGTPNVASTTHLCQWPRDTGAACYTFGTERLAMPDVARSGCVVLWGSNPSANFLSLARAVVAAQARGAKLLVVDPRRIGLANKADLLLQLRPGTDGALALGLIHLLIQSGRYDEAFVRAWTNAPLLVRADTGHLLQVEALAPHLLGQADGDVTGSPRYVAALEGRDALVAYDPRLGRYRVLSPELKALSARLLLRTQDFQLRTQDSVALRGAWRVLLADGREVECRPVFERLATVAAAHPPDVVARITGVPAEQLVAAARLLAEQRPVSHYFHNGLVQHTNATQAARAIEVLYALLGDFDRPGGNVPAPEPRVRPIQARSALPEALSQRRLGRQERPIGPPARPGNVAAYDLYEAALEGQPYPVRALVAFGGNLLLANGDTLRGRAALQRLEFFAQMELFHTPTSRLADVLLPAASFLESPALQLGFRYPIEAMAHVQRREAVVEPRYERRSDIEVIFALACRLGLGEHFWGGDVEAAYNAVLEPSGLTWEALAARPHGVSVPSAALRYRKYADLDASTGAPSGFATPTRKVELFSVTFAAHGFAPLPTYVEPALSPVSAPELAEQFPLVLTNAKRAQYLHSQGRGLPSLRKAAPTPTAQVHPRTAARYGIANGAWIAVETSSGSARAQVHVTDSILPGVVCVNHGWWQGCAELGLPALDPFSAEGANVNLLVLNDRRDPISGGTPHRSSLCRIRPVEVSEPRP